MGGTTAGDLSTAGQADYYSFTGKAGQVIDIYTVAQGSTASAAFDPTWIDTVVTLFDANDKQIAENNDSVPPRNGDSELITMLPADGTYCVRVEECWTWASNPASSCAGTADKTSTVYKVGVNLLDSTKPGLVQDQDAGGAPTPVTYAKVVGGSGCYLSTVWGKLPGMTDVDTFSFALPPYCAPSLPAGTRALFSLFLLPTGPYGNGSTTPAGKVYLTDATDAGTTPIAEISGGDYQGYAQLWPPADLTKPYLFSIEHAPSAPGANDFFVVLVGSSISNVVETDETGNDMLSGAQAAAKSTQAGSHYYADGDIVSDTDVDWWTVPVGTNTMVDVSCGSQRGGSGLRGFTMTVVDAANPTTMIATTTESATSDAYTGYQPIGSATQLGVKFSTTLPHDPNVTSSFYHCGIHLK
jgi:hypothetical protein